MNFPFMPRSQRHETSLEYLPQKRKIVGSKHCRRLWNGLVQSKQRCSQFLGRKAFLLAWKDLDVKAKLVDSSEDDADADSAMIYNRQVEWVQEFEQLLFH
jgi:hypothetical protein